MSICISVVAGWIHMDMTCTARNSALSTMSLKCKIILNLQL